MARRKTRRRSPRVSSRHLSSAAARARARALHSEMHRRSRDARGAMIEVQWLMRRISNRARFLIERLIQRGAGMRLLLIGGLIVAISVVAGLVATLFSGDLRNPASGIWWAFLRMTDPGYLGDDEGTVKRTISLVVTVAGYVLFMGALIAIMTQWLHGKMGELELGLTPIAQKNHVLILGWTTRTPDLVRGLMLSQRRVKRFLEIRDENDLHIVLLVEQVSARMRSDLQQELGALWDDSAVTLRSGTSLRLDHLRRADFDNAAVIIIPGEDLSAGSGSLTHDTRTVKTVLTLGRNLIPPKDRQPPSVVTEIFDARQVPVVRNAYPHTIDVLASDRLIARLMAQSARHPGYSAVAEELLTFAWRNELFIREVPAYDGKRLGDLFLEFPRAILLGVVRPSGDGFRAILNPPDSFIFESEDALVLMASQFEDTEPPAEWTPGPPAAVHSAAANERPLRRVLVLGWNHKVSPFLLELSSRENEPAHIDVCSVVSAADRERIVSQYAIDREGFSVTHVEADYAVPGFFRRQNADEYDNIVFFSSDRFATEEEADARTVLGALLLKEYLAGRRRRPAILMELLDSENRELFGDNGSEVLVSPLLVSFMLVQTALRRELAAAFEVLFGPTGAEVLFAPPGEYLPLNAPVTFGDVQRAVHEKGDIALGIQPAPGRGGQRTEPLLNPPRGASRTLTENDRIIVLSTTG